MLPPMPRRSYVPKPGESPPQSRIETAHLRRLPDFIIIGAQKAGTTSLFHYLNNHPDVGPAWRKEIHFFDRWYSNGLDWYRAHFPLYAEATITGEGSTNYLQHPDAPLRMRHCIPNAKLIVMLRNPVDRAYSQHQMNVRKGIETLSFEDALEAEPYRLQNQPDCLSTEWRVASYLTRGLYASQLQRWLDQFPQEQLLVIKSEEFFEDPDKEFRRVLAFLDLEPCVEARYEVLHDGGDYPRILPATRERLAAYYAPWNQQLYELIDRNLGWDDA